MLDVNGLLELSDLCSQRADLVCFPCVLVPGQETLSTLKIHSIVCQTKKWVKVTDQESVDSRRKIKDAFTSDTKRCDEVESSALSK